MPEQRKKTPCGIGLMAHVDAGKTTLSEALLYVSGTRRTLGRGGIYVTSTFYGFEG